MRPKQVTPFLMALRYVPTCFTFYKLHKNELHQRWKWQSKAKTNESTRVLYAGESNFAFLWVHEFWRETYIGMRYETIDDRGQSASHRQSISGIATNRRSHSCRHYHHTCVRPLKLFQKPTWNKSAISLFTYKVNESSTIFIRNTVVVVIVACKFSNLPELGGQSWNMKFSGK